MTCHASRRPCAGDGQGRSRSRQAAASMRMSRSARVYAASSRAMTTAPGVPASGIARCRPWCVLRRLAARAARARFSRGEVCRVDERWRPCAVRRLDGPAGPCRWPRGLPFPTGRGQVIWTRCGCRGGEPATRATPNGTRRRRWPPGRQVSGARKRPVRRSFPSLSPSLVGTCPGRAPRAVRGDLPPHRDRVAVPPGGRAPALPRSRSRPNHSTSSLRSSMPPRTPPRSRTSCPACAALRSGSSSNERSTFTSAVPRDTDGPLGSDSIPIQASRLSPIPSACGRPLVEVIDLVWRTSTAPTSTTGAPANAQGRRHLALTIT